MCPVEDIPEKWDVSTSLLSFTANAGHLLDTKNLPLHHQKNFWLLLKRTRLTHGTHCQHRSKRIRNFSAATNSPLRDSRDRHRVSVHDDAIVYLRRRLDRLVRDDGLVSHVGTAYSARLTWLLGRKQQRGNEQYSRL